MKRTQQPTRNALDGSPKVVNRTIAFPHNLYCYTVYTMMSCFSKYNSLSVATKQRKLASLTKACLLLLLVTLSPVPVGFPTRAAAPPVPRSSLSAGTATTPPTPLLTLLPAPKASAVRPRLTMGSSIPVKGEAFCLLFSSSTMSTNTTPLSSTCPASEVFEDLPSKFVPLSLSFAMHPRSCFSLLGVSLLQILRSPSWLRSFSWRCRSPSCPWR